MRVEKLERELIKAEERRLQCWVNHIEKKTQERRDVQDGDVVELTVR
jgi:hypothetical protein